MLKDDLRTMVNNSFKEKFYGKKNILTAFPVSHKSDVKTFLKLIINHC